MLTNYCCSRKPPPPNNLFRGGGFGAFIGGFRVSSCVCPLTDEAQSQWWEHRTAKRDETKTNMDHLELYSRCTNSTAISRSTEEYTQALGFSSGIVLRMFSTLGVADACAAYYYQEQVCRNDSHPREASRCKKQKEFHKTMQKKCSFIFHRGFCNSSNKTLACIRWAKVFLVKCARC